MLSQEFDALAVVLCGIGIIKHSRPRCRVLDDKGETVLPLQRLSTAILQLRDREPVGIVVLRRWDIAIPKGEESDIDISLLHILETYLDRPPVFRHIVFHGDYVMTGLA
jgi:hypothetical protein